MVTTSLPVVVGVDGDEHSARALRYAVSEAHRHRAGITIVHAINETQPIATPVALYNADAFSEVARRLVADAEKAVHELDPDLHVRTVVEPGSCAAVLATVGENASAIVVGHRDRSLVSRILTHSIATGVAARAHSPVVSVPQGWEEPQQPRPVVVGVDEATSEHDALVVAFAQAERRNTALVVLHAWRLPTAYDETIVSQVAVEEWRADAVDQLSTALASMREEHPGVEVEVAVRHEHPASALVKASHGSDLVVVGRRGHGAPFGHHLGSTGRALIREAACPVMIAPQR